jgi:pantetheine-phosphate adenylyltransferase
MLSCTDGAAAVVFVRTAGGWGLGRNTVRRAVCPGSFDPVTNGHLDIIDRSSRLYDEVIVAVLVNQTKAGLFSHEERIEMLREVTKGYPNVRIAEFRGLLVDFCRAEGAAVVVKGLRAVSDFDYELQMAQMNKQMKANIETVFLFANPKLFFSASRLIKEVAGYGKRLPELVPDSVMNRLRIKLKLD